MPFPVRDLLRGHDEPLCVHRNDLVSDALSQMIDKDYSQLPVINDQGRLVGIISEQGIVRTYYHLRGEVQLLGLQVHHCEEPPLTISVDRSLLDALNLMRGNDYALVVVEGEKPVGIITHYDTTHYLRDLYEGLVWIEDIELTLRKEYIEKVFPPGGKAMLAALMRAFRHDHKDPTKPRVEYEDLTLQEHIQLITTADNWEKFNGVFESKNLFVNFMEPVQVIRNKLAHFRGRLGQTELDALKHAYYWLLNCPKIEIDIPAKLQTIHIDVTHDGARVNDGYTALQVWLMSQKDKQSTLRVAIEDIGKLTGDSFPAAALEHRSWWSSENKSERLVSTWIEAGWEVEDVDLVAGEVTFRYAGSAATEIATPAS